MRSFSYDTVGQLTNEVRTGTNAYSVGYSYDGAGNRLTKTLGGITEYYDYDAANKLQSAGAKSYTYDGAGNTVSVTTGSDTTNLTWDGAERMTGITYPTSATNSFVYNGLGQRVGNTDSTGTLSYKLADDAIDSNVLADGQATYQYGIGLVSEVRGGTSRVYHADSLGTTRAMSSSSGSASASLETDAFGQTVSVGGTFTPFGFAGGHGYQSDPDSGLMKLGHRYYDASIGRFLSRDPIQDGDNWYVYAENDPINGIDPNGLKTLNADQRAKVKKAIEVIKARGDVMIGGEKVDVAAEMTGLLNSGGIGYTPSGPKGHETAQGLTDKKKGTNNLTLFPSAFTPIGPTDKNLDTLVLASLLVHETVHRHQSAEFVNKNINRAEYYAWGVSHEWLSGANLPPGTKPEVVKNLDSIKFSSLGTTLEYGNRSK